MNKYNDLKEKALYLRENKNLTLTEITEQLGLNKTTVYYWIKDIKIPRTDRQKNQQLKAARAYRLKYKRLRNESYQRGWEEAPIILQDRKMRDFVVFYLAEGYRKGLHAVSVVNVNVKAMMFVNDCMKKIAGDKKLIYNLRIYPDHNEIEMKIFWSQMLKVDLNDIRVSFKEVYRVENKRKRSNHACKYGIMTIAIYDTYLKQRLLAWMDYLQEEWVSS